MFGTIPKTMTRRSDGFHFCLLKGVARKPSVFAGEAMPESKRPNAKTDPEKKEMADWTALEFLKRNDLRK